jgi:TolA-binding protein
MRDESTQKIVDAVAEVTRKGIGEISSRQLDLGWESLQKSIEQGKYPSIPIIRRTRWWMRGLAVASAGVVLGLAAYRLMPARRSSSLHYAVEGAALGPGEAITVAATSPAKLTFSDDSQIHISPRSKVAVLSVDSHGSRIALADGELDVSIRHRPDSSWQLEAGPFSVRVTGTSFHLGFDATRGRLSLQMVTGTVEVRSSNHRVAVLNGGEFLELFVDPRPAIPVTLPIPSDKAPVEPQGPTNGTGVPAPAVAAAHPGNRRRSTTVERAGQENPGNPSEPWPRLIAHGEFAAVIAEAEKRGIDHILEKAGAEDLTALADASRYTRRGDLARQALLRLRSRFPGTMRASEAAFFLGRLAEVLSSPGDAVVWYETYLEESAHGPYAGEALGRKIALLARSDRGRASGAARQYLERFPQGPQAKVAKSLLESPTE